MNQALENCNLVETDTIIARMKTTNKQLERYQNVDYYRLEEYLDNIGHVLIILVFLSFVVIVISQVYVKSSL